MTWNPERMKTAFAECLPQWRQRMQQAGVTSVYSFVSAMALWPVAEAAKNGEWAAAAALGSVLASVGGSVLAGRLQNWKDESDGAQQLAADVEGECLLAELAWDFVLSFLQWLWKGFETRLFTVVVRFQHGNIVIS
ncbi:MAG: hypothetical protein ETSY2_35405 [Candidatus Entotheonella gemina]|uniref:Uncharacterized protein n=1 Tax=Candidatus Entotheonella gemina TaxID=1429439 RepID=W4LX68_9BACT|nr:MAG: hypothetical protein ETSY2_35405 [Candidatus Entotheonella gemina]